MINDQQQTGIRYQGFRSVSLRNLPFEMMSNAAEGFSSQQGAMELEEGTITGQRWTTGAAAAALLSDTCFESTRAECSDRSIISSWPEASEIGSLVHANHTSVGLGLAADSAVETNCATSLLQSKDTLQSLIQSSIRCNQNTESFEENFGYQISNEFPRNQPRANKFRDFSHYPNISFQKNFQVENEAKDYYHEGHNYSPITRNTSERATLMTKRNRMRWTQELHNQFIECVNRLGGAKKATPKGILKLMNCDGLTIFHIKSHLQKYRVVQYIPEAKEDVEIRDETWRIPSPELDQEMGAKIFEALKMQIDVQRRLHEQLQCQKDLQSRIEEQAQQLKKMFDLQAHTDIKSAKGAN